MIDCCKKHLVDPEALEWDTDDDSFATLLLNVNSLCPHAVRENQDVIVDRLLALLRNPPENEQHVPRELVSIAFSEWVRREQGK
jgi:hypothetical protein